MTSFDLLNTPDELMSQKPVIAAHQIDVYSNFKSKEERKANKVKRKAKRADKKVHRKEKRAAAKEERKGMGVGKRILNVVQKANPVAVVPRSSFLLALRVNIFGISRRLYPATLTDAEVVAKGFDLENAKKAREVIEKKFVPVWSALGGRKISLYENIKKGFNKPIFKTKKVKALNNKIKSSEAKAAAKPVAKKTSSFQGDADDNSLYNPHKVAGVNYQLYVSRNIAEPLSNFDANQFDLDMGKGDLKRDFIDITDSIGTEKTSSFIDLSEMRSNSDCVACSSFDGDEQTSGFIDLSEMRSNSDCVACSSFDGDNDFSSVAGADDAAIAGYISAGLGIVATLVKMLTNGGVKKNPYKEGTAEYDEAEKDTELEDPSAPAADEATLNKIKAAAAEDAKKGISAEEMESEENKVADEVEKEVGGGDKIMGMDKTLFWSGVAVLGVIGAGLLIYKMKAKGASAPIN